MSGQGRVSRLGEMMGRLAAAVALAASLGSATAQAAERVTPSGLPVPRYVTLKFDKVNARAGPGEDHRVLWEYRVRGLPVQVVAETSEWRRICDPQGGLAWVHRRVTDGRRTVLNTQAGALPLRSGPRPEAPILANLNTRAVAELVRCEAGWCRVRVDNVVGWTAESALWGVRPGPQCR
jgi:SH3-like domain-containing protein